MSADGLVLVVQQRQNTWSLPKGHVECGEDLLEAAQREIHEETGIRHLVLLRALGHYQRLKPQSTRFLGGEIKDIYMFLFTTFETKLIPKDSDNPEARWVPRQSVAALLSYREDREFFLSVLSELPAPSDLSSAVGSGL